MRMGSSTRDNLRMTGLVIEKEDRTGRWPGLGYILGVFGRHKLDGLTVNLHYVTFLPFSDQLLSALTFT